MDIIPVIAMTVIIAREVAITVNGSQTLKGIALTSYGCPDFEPFLGPPKGEGFQLWETTTEGSPVSPVFETLDELCEWWLYGARTNEGPCKKISGAKTR